MTLQAAEYILGRSDGETRRLILQDQIYRQVTRRLLRAAGVGPGMSVLDVGSGAGDVALMLADLVGPTGRVLGIDMNPEILETARQRVASAGWGNVTFRPDRPDVLEVEPGFDAVVGRWILMYLPDPAAVLRRLAALLKPGGIVAFGEIDLGYPPRTIPMTPVHQQLGRWMVPPAGSPGPDVRIGTRLFRIFQQAGLPAPQMLLEAPVGGGADWPGYEYLAETLRSLLPAMMCMPGFAEAGFESDGLADRLREEAVAAEAIQQLPALVGAWTRAPVQAKRSLIG